MAEVPARFIKNKKIDFDSEIFSCLNLPFTVAGYDGGLFYRIFKNCKPLPLEIQPPSIGVFSLLEVIDSLFIKDFSNSDAMDFCRALYISYYRKDAALEVKEWVQSGGKSRFKADDVKTWLFWDFKIAKFAEKIHAERLTLKDLIAFRNFLTVDTFSGYEMIPNMGGGAWMPYLFGAETIAGVAMVSEKLNIRYDDVIWDVPLCLIGHIAACETRRNGVKGVTRPKDEDDIRLQLKLANEREAKGELHPWQISRPDIYPLTAKQEKARPEIKKEYADAFKSFLKEKEKPVDLISDKEIPTPENKGAVNVG